MCVFASQIIEYEEYENVTDEYEVKEYEVYEEYDDRYGLAEREGEEVWNGEVCCVPIRSLSPHNPVSSAELSQMLAAVQAVAAAAAAAAAPDFLIVLYNMHLQTISSIKNRNNS